MKMYTNWQFKNSIVPNNCELSSTKYWQEMFSFALEYLYEVELFVKCCFYIWKYCWIFCQMWFSFVEIPESFIKMLSVTNIVDFMVFLFTFLVTWPEGSCDLLSSLGVHLFEQAFKTLSLLKWLIRFEPKLSRLLFYAVATSFDSPLTQNNLL